MTAKPLPNEEGEPPETMGGMVVIRCPHIPKNMVYAGTTPMLCELCARDVVREAEELIG